MQEPLQKEIILKRLFRLRITVITLCLITFLPAQDVRRFGDAYRGKFVVVLKEGLAVGLCNETEPGWTGPTQPVLTDTIRNGVVDLTQKDTFLFPLAKSPGCSTVIPEPVHKGEVLQVLGAGILNVYGTRLIINVKNVSPHAIQRGVGAFEHQSLEIGQGQIVFMLDEKDHAKEIAKAQAVASEWFRVFDSQESAAVFGNTASGAFVREIKARMAIADVEKVLGPPQTKVDLGSKVLYKYKDMTVEFNGGVVVDVR